MRKFLLLLTVLTACGVADATDGEADDPGDCCWLLSDDAIANCIRESVDDWSIYDTNEDGCIDVRCFESTADFGVLVCPAE